MRRRVVFEGLVSLEMLDLRLSPSSLFSGVAPAAPAVYHVKGNHDDPLPSPMPAPCDAGGEPPITQPVLPPTGPAGPGSS